MFKNWSKTTKIIVALIVIGVIVAAYFNWDKISSLWSGGRVGDNERSSNPKIQALRDRASDISSRMTSLIDDTNRKLREAGSDGVILPNGKQVPKGLCKCWSILWNAFGFYSKGCCSDLRASSNQAVELILNDFKSKASQIESSVSSLKQDTESIFPGNAQSKEKKCPCWCIKYWVYICHNSKGCCDADNAGAAE